MPGYGLGRIRQNKIYCYCIQLTEQPETLLERGQDVSLTPFSSCLAINQELRQRATEFLHLEPIGKPPNARKFLRKLQKYRLTAFKQCAEGRTIIMG